MHPLLWSVMLLRITGPVGRCGDFLPNAQIPGFDVAADTQVTDEPRITTYLCDSTNSQQTAAILSRMRVEPDLIIDDGLHAEDAQIATLKNFYPALRPGGLYVVEDVWPDNVENILEQLKQLDPGCPFFVDRSRGRCFAIVIRRPREESWVRRLLRSLSAGPAPGLSD